MRNNCTSDNISNKMYILRRYYLPVLTNVLMFTTTALVNVDLLLSFIIVYRKITILVPVNQSSQDLEAL